MEIYAQWAACRFDNIFVFGRIKGIKTVSDKEFLFDLL